MVDAMSDLTDSYRYLEFDEERVKVEPHVSDILIFWSHKPLKEGETFSRERADMINELLVNAILRANSGMDKVKANAILWKYRNLVFREFSILYGLSRREDYEEKKSEES